jgi:hypothetical protein
MNGVRSRILRLPITGRQGTAELLFSFSRGGVLDDVLDHRHLAADLKNSILGGDGK